MVPTSGSPTGSTAAVNLVVHGAGQALSALDLLSVNNLINYFGKAEMTDNVEVGFCEGGRLDGTLVWTPTEPAGLAGASPIRCTARYSGRGELFI